MGHFDYIILNVLLKFILTLYIILNNIKNYQFHIILLTKKQYISHLFVK